MIYSLKHVIDGHHEILSNPLTLQPLQHIGLSFFIIP